jgi:hypothetical protein
MYKLAVISTVRGLLVFTLLYHLRYQWQAQI